jgi:hypothetical protein
MGFFRQQEVKMAQRLLTWQYERIQRQPPPEPELARQAAQLVDDAHRIARERGRNVIAIIKEMVADIKKK